MLQVSKSIASGQSAVTFEFVEEVTSLVKQSSFAGKKKALSDLKEISRLLKMKVKIFVKPGTTLFVLLNNLATSLVDVEIEEE